MRLSEVPCFMWASTILSFIAAAMQSVGFATPGFVFFRYAARRVYYGLWFMYQCDERLSRWTVEHTWEMTTRIAYAKCEWIPMSKVAGDFSQFGMILADQTNTDQFEHLNWSWWVPVCQTLQTLALVCFFVTFVMSLLTFIRLCDYETPCYSRYTATGVAFLVLGSAGAAMIFLANSIYVWQMYERCSYVYEQHSIGDDNREPFSFSSYLSFYMYPALTAEARASLSGATEVRDGDTMLRSRQTNQCFLAYSLALTTGAAVVMLLATLLRFCDRLWSCCVDKAVEETKHDAFRSKNDPRGLISAFAKTAAPPDRIYDDLDDADGVSVASRRQKTPASASDFGAESNVVVVGGGGGRAQRPSRSPYSRSPTVHTRNNSYYSQQPTPPVYMQATGVVPRATPVTAPFPPIPSSHPIGNTEYSRPNIDYTTRTVPIEETVTVGDRRVSAGPFRPSTVVTSL